MTGGPEDGMVATPVLFVVWFGLLLAIAVVDVGSYLVAAGRAQAAADAAALAAIGVEADAGLVRPETTASWVASRNGARLDRCDCSGGRGHVEVSVSVPVPGLFVPRVAGMQRVRADAAAELVVPPPGESPRPPPDAPVPPRAPFRSPPPRP